MFKIKFCACGVRFVSSSQSCYKCRNGISAYQEFLLLPKKKRILTDKEKLLKELENYFRFKVINQLKKDGYKLIWH